MNSLGNPKLKKYIKIDMSSWTTDREEGLGNHALETDTKIFVKDMTFKPLGKQV